MNSFDVVAVFGNKVECCFDVVAGVDGALCVLPVRQPNNEATQCDTQTD